jgi:UDP-N-acetylmuramate dehydrogenase
VNQEPPGLRGQVPLAPYTTFRIGGPARWLVEPEDQTQFAAALRWALAGGVPYFVMGGGANVLVHDTGFDGLVIVTRRLDRVSIDGDRVAAECGVMVDDLVDRCLEHGLTGLEFAAGLPGSVGGAIFMNARAYGGEFAGVVEQVDALVISAGSVTEHSLEGSGLGYSYKKSVFQKGAAYVRRVLLRLKPGDQEQGVRTAVENRRKRRDAGQFAFPNAGCIFKNNYGLGRPTGSIIDSLGLKGAREGGARVFEKHANFIVNTGTATAGDVHRLIQMIEGKVEQELGIRLDREIVLLGF